MALEPKWSRVLLVGTEHNVKYVKLDVDVGLTGFELTMTADDSAPLVLAKPGWDYNAKQLMQYVADGVVALEKIEAERRAKK